MNDIKEIFLKAYDKYASSVLRHIYFRVNNKQVAEDLTQETFFRAWRQIAENKEKEFKSFKSYFYKIANNLVIDYWRQKSRMDLPLEDIMQEKIANSINNQLNQFEQIFNKKLIENYLLELNDEYRQILIYRYVDGFNIKEISEITGKTPNNISVIIHRALKILKEKIKNV